MRTHGICELRDGRVVVFHQAVPAVLIYSPRGELLNRWGTYPGAHGLTLIERAGEEFLWLTDEALGVAELVTLDGAVLQRLDRPPHPAYAYAPMSPTWVAEEQLDGRPVRIWLADGYGAGLVHAYDGEGRYEFTLDGTSGAGLFSCPHGIAVDPRPDKGSRLLVADRGNKRVQEFSSDGCFLRAWGEDFLHSPDMFAFRGDLCAIPELFGRVTVVDGGNNLVEHIGDQPNARHLRDWPNVADDLLRPGLFNSPHAAVWSRDGSLFVVEWIRYGRIAKLSPL